MRKLGVLLFVLSCGGTPAPRPVIANVTAKPAAATCGDAGVILRGHVEGDEQIGKSREAVIANACAIDRWSADVIACVASSPTPGTCLDQLSKDQRASYDEKLAAWDDQYGGHDYGGDEYGAADVDVDCESAVKDVASYAPATTLKDADLEWDVTLRRPVLVDACWGWDPEVKKCVQDATDGATEAACLDKLEAFDRDDLKKRLTEVEELATRTAAARTKPVDCKKLVAAHYADAKWKGKLDTAKPAERKKLIAQSREMMTKACTEQQWSEAERACIFATDDGRCYTAGGHMAGLWGFPAAGLARANTGIVECDAYGDAVLKLGTCEKLPKESRDALLQAYQESAAAWTGAPADLKAQLASACKAGYDAIQEVAKTSCP